MSIIRSKNGLYIEVYDGTTRIVDASNGLITASNLRHQTMYPGGIYGSASFYVARDVVRQWAVKGAQRLIFRNGRTIVYEGKIDDLDRTLQSTSQGVTVTASGYWGALMNRRRWRKRWADTTINDEYWFVDETDPGGGLEKCFVDRNNRIRFTPKAEAWGNGEYIQLKYNMPTGETVKRVTYDYDFQEGGQAWELALNDGTGATLVSHTASGTGSTDHTLVTPRQQVRLVFYSRAAQTPTSDGTYYGEVTNLVVYSETGSITMQQAAIDIVGEMSSELNSSTARIGSNTYSLVPLVFDDFATMGEMLVFMGNIGDGSQNPWHSYLDHSEIANTPDGNPVLVTEQRPALTDYDYIVQVGKDIDPPLSIVHDFGIIRNWIVIQYIDSRGFTQYVSPDDDANLKDTTSITDYGQLDAVINVGEATTAIATNFGRRFLSRYKDPEWTTLSPISIPIGIRTKDGSIIPSSQIRAGKRIKIANYLDPNLTFLISGTNYDDDTETTQVTAGPLDFWMYNAFSHPPAPPEVLEDKDSQKGPHRRPDGKNWYEILGYSREEWLSMSIGERYRLKQKYRKNKKNKR